MAEAFVRLPPADRREALEVAASAAGRPLHLLEKDIWAVWALSVLFGAPYGGQLVFKGGTSLSKVYGAIRRFSEDIDLTYDIRALLPDLAGEDAYALPSNRSQEKRWTKEVRGRLPEWISETVLPSLERALREDSLAFTIRHEGDKVFIDYDAIAEGTGYVSPTVTLEFGARSSGEPCEPHNVVCDAARHLPQLAFPTARPRTMMVERTFWEKATAIHTYCCGASLRTERFARHWYDLACLDEAGLVEPALAARDIADAVAAHKAMFFREKGADGSLVDYAEAVSGSLRLVPADDARDALATDYARMVEDGLLLDEAEPFDALLGRCTDIEQRANRENERIT